MTSEELIKHVERMLADSRKQDADARHVKFDAVDKAFMGFDTRLIDLEHACRKQEEVYAKTEATAARLMALLQGDPELGNPGFINRQTKSMGNIEAQIAALESDKSESRAHRTNHADIPARVTKLEQDAEKQEVRLEAYRTSAKWGWVAITVVWGIIVAAWKLLSGKLFS